MTSVPLPAVGPARIAALAAIALAVVFIVLYRSTGLDVALYDWSKTLASYEYREHLRMSKRYLLQYGYGAALFAILVASKYVFVSDVRTRVSDVMSVAGRYCLVVFVVHFPAAFFFAAVLGSDSDEPVDDVSLIALTLAFSIGVGAFAFGTLKPEFDRWGERLLGRPRRGTAPTRIAQSLSDAMHGARVVATASVMFNHFQHFALVGIGLPTIGRASIPLFLMMAGYFAMLSLRNAREVPWRFVARRYHGLWFILVPAIAITAIFGSVGFFIRPEIYSDKHAVIAGLGQFAIETLKTLTYTGEFWFGTGPQGFAGNEALWTIFYIMPFTAILAFGVLLRGWRRWTAVLALIAVCGPTIMMLAPLYFAGALAYRIHEGTARA